MKLSKAMGQALLAATTIGDHREIPYSAMYGPSTRSGLVNRALIELRPRARMEVGPPHMVLTEAGEAERKRLIGELPRVAKSTGTCGRKLDYTYVINECPPDLTCVREPGHHGRHRNTRVMTRNQSYVWEDRECVATTTLPIADGTGQPAPVYGHKKLDGAIDPATTPLGRPVGDFQVKIWYASGSSEVISHIDFMSAAAIYSEAVDRERAIAAEVHCPGGCLAATFTREVDSTGNRG